MQTVKELTSPPVPPAARERSHQRLLLVGPIPPPLDGTSVSFEMLCEEIRRTRPDLLLRVVDSSPKRLKVEGARLTLRDLLRAVRLLAAVGIQLPRADCIVIFGSNGILARLAPPIVRLAGWMGRPCFIRPFGGSLVEYLETLSPARREALVATLRECEAVIVQTRDMQERLGPTLGRDVMQLAGYRRPAGSLPERAERDPATELRLVFLGHVRREKGVGVLLDSVAKLRSQGRAVRCDVFGPIYGDDDGTLSSRLEGADGVTHRGVLPQAELLPTLAQYDALIFPSYYSGEGHPGVLIEAMVAGLPIITTRFQALPELVEHGVSGLLVEPRDADALADAITRLLDDDAMLEQMAVASRERAADYDVRTATGRFLEMLGAGTSCSA